MNFIMLIHMMCHCNKVGLCSWMCIERYFCKDIIKQGKYVEVS